MSAKNLGFYQFVVICILVLSFLPMAFANESSKVDFTPFFDAMPPCDTATLSCVGITLHIVVTEEGPVQTPEWFTAQVEGANRLFALIGVGFALREVKVLPIDFLSVETRSDRDRLGRRRYRRGTIHVFLVQDLANVDSEGYINGVHWRYRSNKSKRWIIMCNTAWELTLAHEFGHFFGLPHSTYEISLMNKSPREEPPPEERTFAPEEITIMKKSHRKMFRSKELLRAKK